SAYTFGDIQTCILTSANEGHETDRDRANEQTEPLRCH
ncbi:uncharacterized, partial [Tachysurus ichikawai]